MTASSPVPISTYQGTYKVDLSKPVLPPIKYHQLPSLYHIDDAVQYTSTVPVFPQHLLRDRRRHSMYPEGPALGLGTKGMNTQRYLDPKPILNTLPPHKIRNLIPKSARKTEKRCLDREKCRVFQTRFGPMDSELVDSLVNSVRYTSLTRLAANEACLPVREVTPPESTVESKADIVRLEGLKYESGPADWQRTVLWDSIQLRPPVTNRPPTPPLPFQHEDFTLRRSKGTTRLAKVHTESPRDRKREPDPTPLIRNLVRENKLSQVFVRQCPGYAGYVPRSLPEGEMAKKQENPSMVSTMKSAYRELPVDEYQKQLYARRGAFSKTVTLTYPFNPYSKTEQN